MMKVTCVTGFTFNVTAIVAGDPAAPEAVTVTVSVYVPAPNPEVFAPMVSVAGDPPAADPEVPDNVSQDCVLLALQLNVPEPVLEIVTGCEVGLAAPAVAENVSVPLDNDTVGGVIKLSVMLTVDGDPVTPDDVTVTVSV